MNRLESRPMPAQSQFTVRFPDEQLERIDRIASALTDFNGAKASRADAVRFIVSKGFENAEAALNIKPSSKAKR